MVRSQCTWPIHKALHSLYASLTGYTTKTQHSRSPLNGYCWRLFCLIYVNLAQIGDQSDERVPQSYGKGCDKKACCVRYSPAAELDGAELEQQLVQLAGNDLGISQVQVREATALSLE